MLPAALLQQPKFGVIAYSARALAQAAVELGYEVTAVDAFRDQDTLDIASCTKVARWPQDIGASTCGVTCDAWLLGGGMEHSPQLLAQLARHAPILGPTSNQLRQLRRLRYWQALAESISGLAWPRTRRSPSSLQTHATIFKPFKGSGGIAIGAVVQATDRHSDPQKPGQRGYWQEWVAGRSLGITLILSPSGVKYCGATESLSASVWPGPTPFVYRGSIGPVPLGSEQQAAVLEMGQRVGQELDYCGWLQADFIEGIDGCLWLLEINPRWTAGMEVLHRCQRPGRPSPLSQHLDAVGYTRRSNDEAQISRNTHTAAATKSLGCRHFAKAILYAPRDVCLKRDFHEAVDRCRTRLASEITSPFHSTLGAMDQCRWNIADVPRCAQSDGLTFRSGEPILTICVGRQSDMCVENTFTGADRHYLLTRLSAVRSSLLAELFQRE